MSSFRKFTAALAALAVSMTSVFTFSVAVAATTFNDASNISSWALNSVTSLADDGVLSGRPDGSFDPKGNLNRAEVAKVAVLAAGLTEDTTGAPHFNDVAASDWFYPFVETLYNNGVVGGINGGALDVNGMATYNPGGTLNRAEGSKILVDAFDMETAYAGTPPNFPDVSSSAWYYDYIETAYAHGILNGYDNGNFGPADSITREQIAVIAQNSRVETADSSQRRSTYTAGAASGVEPTTPPPAASDGTLTVSRSSSMPAAATFPQGASSTSVAAYDFTATGDDVTISNLVVKRTGVGTDGDWTLYIYDGSNRLTSGKTINSTSHEATFTGVNVKVSAGTTKTLTLKADSAASSTGGISYFEISSASKVISNAKSVAGSFPITSNRQEINNSVTAGTITIEKNGSITNPKVGEDNVTIAKFKLTTANEAGSVKQIALLVDGSISATDIQNAKLYQGTTLLASVADVNSKDLLVFNLATPYVIEKGDSRNFEVKADLNTGRGSDTISIYLDEATDLVAVGGNYGFGMSVTYGEYDGVTGTGTDNSYCTLQGGDITISSSGPAASDVAVNAKDVVLMDFNITSVSEVTVKKFGISLTSNDTVSASDAGGLLSGSTSNYTDIKIINKDTGAIVLGPVDASSLHYESAGTVAIDGTATGDTADQDGFYTFQDEFTMAAGESLNLALTCDIANNTGADFVDDTIYGTIDIDDSTLEIKDINNKTVTNSTSVVPTSDIIGKTMTVKSASLTVTKSSTPVSNTSVKGAQDVSLLGLTVAAGAASDVKVTEMVVRVRANTSSATFAGDEAAASDYVNNIELWVGGTKLAGPEGLTLVGEQADGYYKATFDNMDYTIPAGSTIQVVVKGDLSTNVTGTTYIIASIDPNDDITAEDNDGNTITAGGTAELNDASTYNPLLTVSTGGSLAIAVDPDTPKEDIAVAGTSDVVTSKFKFSATDEAFKVQKLSINNRQSGVADGNIGDYDNNIVSIKLSYTNSSGATETKTGYLTNGTADFSGMDLYIEKDDDAVVTVAATLNTISAGALSGEYIDLNLAFNDFEAVAQGSGETYKADKIDADVDTFDFGTITWTTTSELINDADDDTATLASSDTYTVDSFATVYPVGTLLKFGADSATYTAATEPVMVLTEKIDAADTTVTGTIINNADGAIENDDYIYYALPGTGYLTAANRMHVYETKPTIALASSSPSGSRTVAASDNVFVFTISADSKEKVQFRPGVVLTKSDGYEAGAVAVNAALADDTDAGDQLDGSGTLAALDNYVDTDSVSMVSASDLSGYSRINFWFKWTGSPSTFAQMSYNVTASSTADPDSGKVALSQTLCGADAASPATGEWYNCDVSIAAVAAASDTYFHVILSTISSAAGDTLHLDRVIAYNDKIKVDVATDTDLDTYANNATNAGSPVVAYLKEGGSTVATGYISTSTGGGDAASSGNVTFIPTTAIEIAKGTSKTFTLQTNTGDLLAEDAGEDDPLTVSIALGSASDGSVTAGGVWWNDTNFPDIANGGGATAYSLANGDTGVITWLGQVTNTTLNGNTLKY